MYWDTSTYDIFYDGNYYPGWNVSLLDFMLATLHLNQNYTVNKPITYVQRIEEEIDCY